jgi:hypothetical protein
MSEPDGVFNLSPDIEVHAASLAAHMQRCRAKEAANKDYWLQHIKAARQTKEKELSLGISNSMVKTIDSEAAKAHENLRLPDGRVLKDVRTPELMPAIDKLKIPGFSHTLSRSAAILLYAQFIEPIYKAAGEKAVREWLEENNRSD